jgi:CheY-like chemotaxis protein
MAVKPSITVPPSQGGEQQPVRVLAVDDDSRNLLTIGEVLRDVAEIDCARSGEEALRFLLREEFAVILLDVLMPGLNGYQTAELIRQRESSKSTPIIFLTAINKDDAHMLRGYDAGAVDFLFKPFDPLMLRSKVSVFVELFQKTREIKQKAASERRLLEENLLANAQKLEAIRELRRAEERQEAILRALPICVHSRSVDAPFAPAFVSGAVERLTGFPPERFSEDPGFGLSRVHPDDLPLVRSTLKEALRSGSYVCEFRWKCENGAYRHFLDQGVVSRDDEGRPAEILGTLLDITERRHLENQLIHAQKLDAIGKLTGGVAHDFNNLLASILSGLNLLQRQVTMDGKAQRIFDMTEHAAKQGADLIGRMLTFSRRQHLNPMAFNPHRLSETLEPLMRPVLGGLVQIRWQIDEDVWSAHVDPGQLELALMNLAINARDAMPDGGVIAIRAGNRTLEVEEPEIAAGDYVVLRVEDAGEGIPPDLVAKVIEPFFTTKDVGRGTGLGLSTAYGFAKQSGGALRIFSEVGKGTAVELWLPRAPGDGRDKRSALAVEPPAGSSSESATLPKILLVDDSRELCEFTEQILSEHGFDVVSASGGAEALSLLEKDPDRFDLIVTDFAMPIVSGAEVIRLARNIKAEWPCVIITGYADAKTLADLPSDVAVIHKPFEAAELVTAIKGSYSRYREWKKRQRSQD